MFVTVVCRNLSRYFMKTFFIRFLKYLKEYLNAFDKNNSIIYKLYWVIKKSFESINLLMSYCYRLDNSEQISVKLLNKQKLEWSEYILLAKRKEKLDKQWKCCWQILLNWSSEFFNFKLKIVYLSVGCQRDTNIHIIRYHSENLFCFCTFWRSRIQICSYLEFGFFDIIVIRE